MGDFYVAGRNADYDLGLGNATQQNTHIQLTGDWLVVRTSSGTGGKFGLGIKADGTLWAWGNNANKQLGLASASYTTPTQVGSGTTWSDLALGDYHTLALKSDGTLWASGLNSSGQCGMGNTTSPVNGFTQVGSGTTWAGVAAGGSCSFAWRADGSLWACGENYGQLGIGTTSAYEHTFTREATSSSLWTEVKTLLSFSLGLRSDGTLWSWGIDSYGETAQGATGTYATPTQIGAGTDWAAIGVGTNTAYAIKTGGTLWAAGRGQYYALGTGNTTDQTSLVQIGSATDWAAVAAGNQFMLALKTSGVPWVVGRNVFGVLGTGNTTDVTTLTALAPAYTPNGVDAGGNASILSVLAEPPAVVSAPITMTVAAPSGTVSAPISMSVTASGTVSAPITLSVVDALDTHQFSLALTLTVGGVTVDHSARLTGDVVVDAEEGAARTAAFTLLPVAGMVDPYDWLGAAVALSLVRVISGVSIPARLFTGVVDAVRFDPSTGNVAFSCSDDLKNRVANLSTAQIDALTVNDLGLDYSVGAQGAAPIDRWDYAQARMAAVCGELDAGVYGELRVTPFAGRVDWGTFTEDNALYDAAYSIDLPQRADIVNQVVIDYEFRRYRCRERVAAVAWANTIYGGTDSIASGYQSPSMSAVKSALDGCGWELLSWALYPGWAYVATSAPPGETGSGWYYAGTPDACGSMTATLGQRHAQEFTEVYQITLSAAESQDTFGVRSKTLRGALSSDWQPGNWESTWSVATPDASSADVDYSGTVTRTDSDEAIRTLCMMARREILASHRTCLVTFTVPCLPELDLIHSATLDTDAIVAGGKVARLVHHLSMEKGVAETEVTLAVQGVAAWGGSVDTSLSAPPDPPNWGPGPDDAATWVTDDWPAAIPHLGRHVGAVVNHDWSETAAGYLVNAPENLTIVQLSGGSIVDSVSVPNTYYDAAWAYPQTGFRVAMPGVADNYRNAPPIRTVSDSRSVVVAGSNPLTLTVG